MPAQNLHELHLRPEVEQVDQESAQDDEAQYEHVFRSPCHARLLHRHGVTLRTACLVVVQREDDGVEEVDEDAQRQNGRSCQRVPVCAQQFANHVVRFGRDDRRDVHRHVEEDEEHEEHARHAHY